MAEAKQLSIKTKRRNAYRLNAQNEIVKSQQVLDDELNAEAVNKLRISLQKFVCYQSTIEKLDEEVVSIVDEEGIEQDIRQACDFHETMSEMIAKIEVAIANFEKHDPDISINASTLPFSYDRKETIKLPKLEIKPFSGNALQWQEFWDAFESTIHQHPKLTPQEKFKYLRSFLGGEALTVADGYRLTAANYDAVVEVLTERYGNPEMAIFAHLDNMLALPVSNIAIESLQKTFDECEKHIRSLVALGMPEQTFGQVFTPILLSKLPQPIRVELHRQNGAKPWTLSNLRQLLRDEIHARTMGHQSFGSSASKMNDKTDYCQGRSDSSQYRRVHPTAASFMADGESNKEPSQPCIFCGFRHFSSQCRKFPDLQSRRTKLASTHCYLCLREGHFAKDCKKASKCFYCKDERRHHSALCPKQFGKTASAPNWQRNKKSTSHQTSSSMNLAAENGAADPKAATNMLSLGEKAVLQTAIATIQGSKKSESVRLLLDVGSSRSFCKASLCDSIGAERLADETVSLASFESSKRRTCVYKSFRLDLQTVDGESIELTVNATPTISCPVQKQTIDTSAHPILKQIVLADTLTTKTELVDIDILIGSDYYYDIVGTEQIRCGNGLVLLDTKLGYVIAGKLSTPTSHDEAQSVMFLNAANELPNSNYDLERLWRLEDVGMIDQKEDPADTAAMAYFNKTVKFDADEQRYMVKWPWKSEAPELPDNYDLATSRLKSLVRRTSPEILQQYHQIIEDQRSKEVIEEAPANPDGELVHYLPHHVVIKPERETTKLRVVYDASSKANRSAMSLNDCLHRGPVFLADLCGLLMRFRLHKTAIISDIEKAFLQISLQPADREVTRFLWLRDLTKSATPANLVCFRFRRVPFGVISSPFLLAAVIKHHLLQHSSDLSKQVLRSLYADNIIHGANDLGSAKDYYRKTKALFASAKMNPREWYSNDHDFISSLQANDIGKAKVVKVLGLHWDTSSDRIGCLSRTYDDAAATKRHILQNIARVFDPNGLFAPVTITGRLLMQRLWQQKCAWDETVPSLLRDEWQQHSKDLSEISSIKIPRRIIPTSPSASTLFEIHVFCDASHVAYGAVAYLRTIQDATASAELIFAKGRVCPLKKRTIPQLELIACVIACRIGSFTKQELDLPIKRIIVWSDSQCALYWIMGKQVATIFVKNRVKEIRSYKQLLFRYVPTKQNPADLITHGCRVHDLERSNLWWHGPEWLSLCEEDWPVQVEFDRARQLSSDDSQEKSTTMPINDCKDALIDSGRFSSWKRLVRVTAWVFRFFNRRVLGTTGQLNADEISHATNFLLKDLQRRYYADIMDSKASKNLVLQLGLFWNQDGLLRCSGRLDNSDLPFDQKYPVLLPKGDRVTYLIIEDYHKRFAHAGVQLVLAQLRKQFWIVHGRSQVKSALRQCRICRRDAGGPYSMPASPPLPDFRSTERASFSCVGLDYLGPLYIRATLKQKVWMCLFTCSVTRAVHLEVILDLTVEQFLLCLRRFTSLYGKPDLIVCDNAKQFHCAEKVLAKVMQEVQSDEEIQSFSASHGIKWKYTVELAPWMGGFYERMVGLVKRAIKRMIGRNLLTLIELQTIAAEVCSVLNSRPLAYSEDEIGSHTITPNDLITHGRPNFMPTDSCQDEYVDKVTPITTYVSRWKDIQSYVDKFWHSWRDDYLNTVRQYVWRPNQRNSVAASPQVNDVVLTKDQLPRSLWKMGKIVTLLRSSDGAVRSAKIRLPNGRHINRPIRLLYPLETSSVASRQPGKKAEAQASATNADDSSSLASEEL